jgi:hypothetical protein
LHLLLKKTNGFIWLKISANTFIKPQDIFKLRTNVGKTDADKIDLEISSDNGLNNYWYFPHLRIVLANDC